MEYQLYDQGDEKLLELAQMPVGSGIAVALRTTGYSANDEVVSLSICDLEGNLLFSQQAKPQNIAHWEPSDASGGMTPSDVADAQELFQFEDRIIELFDKAEIVVCEHLHFASSIMSASWISLPEFDGFDLNEEFRKSHCAKDYPSEPASAVALPDIAAYYGLPVRVKAPDEEAVLIARCYKALVAEHERRRQDKGAAYWEARDARLAAEAAENGRVDAAAQLREKRYRQMNGLLWVAGAIIFVSLVIQLYQRGADAGLMIVAGAVAAFCLIRGAINLKG